MTNPDTMRSFLIAEVEALEPFDFVAVVPAGRPLLMTELGRTEQGQLEVRVPGRPPTIPTIEPAMQKALSERGYASEDPANATNPWVQQAADAASAVDLWRDLLVEVFDAKADDTFDIIHGSHKTEHEAMQRLEVARSRIETIVSDLLGHTPEKDDDGDYMLPVGDVHVMIAPRAAPDGQVVVRIFAITNVGISITPELGLFLARLNFGQMFGRFALDAGHQSIWFDENLLGEQFREEELRFAIQIVAQTADMWDDRFKQMFGGATYQEVLAGRSSEAPPATKPGNGFGQYL